MIQEEPITARTTVREVMTRYPQAEAIFNRYGLTGCGGRKGPMEPVGFFATVHHVDPEALLAELNALSASGGDGSEGADGVAGRTHSSVNVAEQGPAEQPDIYRAFVKTALAVVVTVGCTLGAVNLAAMALAGVTDSEWEAITQAHGHAQIFGWVGLFIMGVAYHVLPRLKATELRGRSLALASYWLVLTGIVLRMVGQPLAESPSFGGIVVLSALAELLGVSFFLYVVLATLRGNPASADFWDKYVVAGAIWFWVTAVATVAISLYTSAAGLDVIPSGLDAPYLHVALMGFVAMMVFGMALRTLPVFMGLKAPNVRAFDLIFWGLNLSVLLKAGSGWTGYFLGPDRFAVAGYAGSALEYGSAIAFIYFLGVFSKRKRDVVEEGASVNYEKFITAAFLWLGVAATMSAAFAAYQAATGSAVPHSLVGSYRHALTVGFISMMIIGMASRIIPVFTGVRLHSDLMLLATFVLLNFGNAVRVITQPLADLAGGPVFLPMGVSGFIEVTALGLFVYNLWRTIDSPADEEAPRLVASAGPIGPNTVVADALKLRPDALAVFVRHGFTQLQNPIGRRTLARAVTVAQAAQMRGVDLEALLRDLNRGDDQEKATPDGEGAGPGEARLGETGGGEQGAQATAELGKAGLGVSRELVMMALKTCEDPEIPVNVVDLGLVYGVRIDGSTVEIDLTLTAPGCPMGEMMLDEVKEAVGQVPGVQDVRVELVFDPPWTPDRMSDAAREQLGMPA